MMNRNRPLFALAGAAFTAAAMYGFAQLRYADEMADGFTVWDVVAGNVAAIAILVALALASPRRRGLRLLWLLTGALWIWLLVLPPLDTSDAGPAGVAFLFRFQSWSGIALPLFIITLAHWRTAYRSPRDLRQPAVVLAVWMAAYSICARYDWVNTDAWKDVNYDAIALACWTFLAAPPLLLVRWILRRDREIHPEAIQAEAWFWTRMAPLLRTRWSAVAAGIGLAAGGFVAVGIFQERIIIQEEIDAFTVWMIVICSLLAGPGFGRALRRRAAAIHAPVPTAVRPAPPLLEG
jgi:hypothetical protein